MPPVSDWPERPDGPADEASRAIGPTPGDPGDELVEWIDSGGSVIDIVTRRRMRAEGLAHRCTYVVVVVGPVDRFASRDAAHHLDLDPDTEVVVHLRADWKDVAPSHWDMAFGGVCGVGEEWSISARRELAEEAGIDLAAHDPLVDLGPVRFVDPDTSEDGTLILGRLFLAAWPDRPVSTDGEAVAFDRVRLGELASWMTGRPVCADTKAVVAPILTALLPRG